MPQKPQRAVAYSTTIDGETAVFVTGFIYEGFGTYLSQYVYELARGEKPVTLYINSPGGLLGEAFAFYDFARVKGLQVNVEVYGQVGSAATIIAAAAGRERIAIGENAEWFVHRVMFINEYGERIEGNPEEAARLNGLLVGAYMELTGMDADAINALLDAGDGGKSISAADAVAMGFAGRVLEAARAAAFKDISAGLAALNTKPMSEQKKTVTVAAKVNLTTMEAIRAAVTNDGTEVQVDVDVEKAVADEIATRDARIAELEGQLAEAATAGTEAQATAEQVQAAQTALAEANAAHERAIAALKDEHTKAIAALKAPTAKPINTDNQEGTVGRIPGTNQEHPGVSVLKQALREAGPLATKKTA